MRKGYGNPYSKVQKGYTLAVINRISEDDKFSVLAMTLTQAGLWKSVEAARKTTGLSKSMFRIIIKPDLEFYDKGAPTGTDPEIVEHLIALFHNRGYRHVAVADSIGSADLWLKNRDVAALADRAGYRYVTADGKPYEIFNLSENLIDTTFTKGTTLYRTKLGRAWVDANYRITIAKNKTHEENSFSLCLQNLLGVLPLRDKEYHYYYRLEQTDICIELLRHTPVHFSIIDAIISNHGIRGTHTVSPLATNTIIASENLLLADWVGALKMGLDPYVSPINARALRAIGLPSKYKILGDLSYYKGWKNVHPLLSYSVHRRNRSLAVSRVLRPWSQMVNQDLFPFKNALDERINHLFTSFLNGREEDPLPQSIHCAANCLLGAFHHLMKSYQVIYAKDNFYRRETSLGIDLEMYEHSDYDAIQEYIQPLAYLAAHISPDNNGLRWQYIKQSVLFEFSRVIPIPFNEFVSCVDISNAVSMMNDNIGGDCVPVSFDNNGRVTRQAERTVYLPQPNWMILYGGDVIDAGKLESIRYEKNRHQIFWKTVVSANNSAQFDDGMVSFTRDDKGMTAITIVARQKFSLPLFWRVVNLDLIPEIKDGLVSDAYTAYFSRTINNFKSSYKGSRVNMGRPWEPGLGEAISDSPKTPLGQLLEIGGRGIEFISSGKFLGYLLKLMSLAFSVSRELRKNIENFNGCYLFKIKNNNSVVTAIFRQNRMEVHEKDTGDANVTVVFKNTNALMNFLLSPKPDILGSLLKQDIAIDGNLNYLLKFAYIAKHIQLWVTGKI